MQISRVCARLLSLARCILPCFCLVLAQCEIPDYHPKITGPTFVPWADIKPGQPTTGRVYFYRQGGFYGAAVTMVVHNGDREIAQLAGGYVTSVVLPAGLYILSFSSDVPLTFAKASINLEVKPGSNNYIDVILQGSDMPANQIYKYFTSGNHPLDRSGPHECSSEACVYIVPEAIARTEMSGLIFQGQLLP